MLRPGHGLWSVMGTIIGALAMVAIAFSSTAVTVDIAPDSLNVFNTTGNYITAYVEPTVIFEDHFMDATWTQNNWQVLSGAWSTDDGQYVGDGTVAARDISLAGAMMSPVEATDFIMTVKVTNVAFGDNDGYGHYQGAIIPFRFSLASVVANSNMAALVFFEDGVRLQFKAPGWTGHAPNSAIPFNPYPIDIGNSEHSVKIVACGSTYRIYIDDMNTPVIEKTFSSTILGTRLGLWAYHNAEARFSDFVVTDCFEPSTVDISTVKLLRAWTDSDGEHTEVIAPAVVEPTVVGDYDGDGIPDLMVKFDRAAVAQYLRDNGIVSGEVDLLITGESAGGLDFSGGDSVKVISKGKLKL